MSAPAPVIVQGTAVGFGDSLDSTQQSPAQREARRESKCNDPFFALLFYIAVFAIVGVAAVFGPDAMSSELGSTDFDYSGYMRLTAVIVVLAFILSAVGLAVLMCIPEFLIKVSLIFSVIMAGLMVVFAFITGQLLFAILGLVMFALTVCYAYFAWSRIPFATANLVTACTAIKKNVGVTVYAYLFAILAGAWSFVWAVSFLGVFDDTYCENQEQQEQDGTCEPGYGPLTGLMLCYFFVHQVLQNSIHVTVAGTVGTWWYKPDECGCCSSAVNNSMLRTLTTSFGSICFGSLLVAIIQTLKFLARQARENGDAGFLACIAECILGCLESLLEYFNKWAFVYVGLYGMPYIQSGKSVLELFQNRGWEAIIADDLVGNALFLVSLLVGGLMGGVGLLLAKFQPDWFTDAGGSESLIGFLLGFLFGLVICSILMSTIGSGVNAVIVLFAEGPAEFQQNHPELSTRMHQVWGELYPTYS